MKAKTQRNSAQKKSAKDDRLKDDGAARRRTIMKRDHLEFGKHMRVSIGNERSQAVQLVIAPGGHEAGGGDGRRDSDQWLYVVEGSGLAIVNGEHHPLRPGSLLLLERGDVHGGRMRGKAVHSVQLRNRP